MSAKTESWVYEEYKHQVEAVYFSEDLAIRHPIFMNIPEPDPELLMRPLAKYSIYIGRTDYGRLYYYDPEIVLNPMLAIIGMPGAGKSHTVKSMVLRLKKKGIDIPVIIVDPEGEYHVVVDQIGEGVVLNIGTEHYINIFDRPYPSMNYRLWVRKAVIPGIIKSLGINPQQTPIMMRILEETIFTVYEDQHGFHPSDPSTWYQPDPTLKEVVDYLEEDVETWLRGEAGKKAGRIYQSKMMLLQRLKRWVSGAGSDFFAYPSDVPLTDLLKQSIVVFNIKALPPEAKNLFNYYIFNYFYALMELLPPLPSFGLRLLLIFDEGWILLKHGKGEESPISPMIRRARKYGFGLIIATQQYSDVSTDILPQVGTVFILRIRDANAVNKLSESLHIPQRIKEKITTLPNGVLVAAPAWKRGDKANVSTPFIVHVEPEIEPMVRMTFYKKESPTEVLRGLRAAMSEKRV